PLVCYCFQITRKEIEELIEQYGLKTVDEVATYSEACNGCRTCYIDIEKILAHYWTKKEKKD
ncbi:MAG: (2Fe-2S)-binding protein, partial [Planctomycetota bacterium]